MNSSLKYKSYAHIDLDALVHNYNSLVECAKEKSPDARPICVVKADAYGHGARECVRALCRAGADFFAVSDVSEALDVREVTAQSKILVLGYSCPENAPALIESGISQAVPSLEYARHLNSEAEHYCKQNNKENVKISIHIKVDTGMSRLGFSLADGVSGALDGIKQVSELPYLRIDGVFSHFACADEMESEMTERQLKRFNALKSELRENGICPAFHICNSAGSIRFGAAGQDYFRLGISLYGHAPSSEVSLAGLLPVMRLYSTVAQVHTLRAGECVSYGATFCAERDMTVATVAIGYADGLLRAFKTGYLILGGRRAKILGRICMDQCIIDASGIDVKEGDTVTVFDESGENTLALAACADTISYELVCLVTKRVARRYIENGKEL